MDNATGFFDLQVNGYGGVDLNQDDLGPDDLHALCRHLEADGVGGILATFTTESLEKMERRMANLVALRRKDPLAERIIAGIHIEGRSSARPTVTAAPIRPMPCGSRTRAR